MYQKQKSIAIFRLFIRVHICLFPFRSDTCSRVGLIEEWKFQTEYTLHYNALCWSYPEELLLRVGAESFEKESERVCSKSEIEWSFAGAVNCAREILEARVGRFCVRKQQRFHKPCWCRFATMFCFRNIIIQQRYVKNGKGARFRTNFTLTPKRAKHACPYLSDTEKSYCFFLH